MNKRSITRKLHKKIGKSKISIAILGLFIVFLVWRLILPSSSLKIQIFDSNNYANDNNITIEFIGEDYELRGRVYKNYCRNFQILINNKVEDVKIEDEGYFSIVIPVKKDNSNIELIGKCSGGIKTLQRVKNIILKKKEIQYEANIPLLTTKDNAEIEFHTPKHSDIYVNDSLIISNSDSNSISINTPLTQIGINRLKIEIRNKSYATTEDFYVILRDRDGYYCENNNKEVLCFDRISDLKDLESNTLSDSELYKFGNIENSKISLLDDEYKFEVWFSKNINYQPGFVCQFEFYNPLPNKEAITNQIFIESNTNGNISAGVLKGWKEYKKIPYTFTGNHFAIKIPKAWFNDDDVWRIVFQQEVNGDSLLLNDYLPDEKDDCESSNTSVLEDIMKEAMCRSIFNNLPR